MDFYLLVKGNSNPMNVLDFLYFGPVMFFAGILTAGVLMVLKNWWL